MNEEATPRPHVANILFPPFYAPAFGDDEARSRGFYEALTKTSAKVVMHQAARMVWLGDQIDEVARGRPALQILFLMIAAEAVAKLTYAYQGESQSRKYVKRFFLEICSDEHRARLARAFRRSAGWLSAEDAVEFFYDVRCDVAHRGKYYDLHLPRTEEDDMFVTWKKNLLTPAITIAQLRLIVLEGAVLAAARLNQ